MAWHSKERPTPFDHLTIEGLMFLDGKQLLPNQTWAENLKFPVISFPSGAVQPIFESQNPEDLCLVHIFGEMQLPYRADIENAYFLAQRIADAVGYDARLVDDQSIELVGMAPSDFMRVTYDQAEGRMLNIEQLDAEDWDVPEHQAHKLMSDEIAAALPDLYSNEDVGMAAHAIVKYFTPDAGWTWYASEFDGDDTFFGLVSGLELEFGYFSLSELRSIRGPLGLRVERDLHYEPKTLHDLKIMHEEERRKGYE